MKRFDALSETEVLALAISNDADMAAEESEHRRRLIDLFTERFGDHIPLLRAARSPLDQTRFDISR